MEKNFRLQPNLLQTTCDSRMCSLEEKSQEGLNVLDKIDCRLSTAEGEINHRHNNHQREILEKTGSIEQRLHCVEEDVLCLLDKTPQPNMEDNKDVKNTYWMLKGKFAFSCSHTHKLGPDKKLNTDSKFSYEEKLVTARAKLS